MPREGHGSRNSDELGIEIVKNVMPREGHGSRNAQLTKSILRSAVMPREGHGSRNNIMEMDLSEVKGHAPRGAWE